MITGADVKIRKLHWNHKFAGVDLLPIARLISHAACDEPFAKFAMGATGAARKKYIISGLVASALERHDSG